MDYGVTGLDGLIGQLCAGGYGGEALSPKLVAYHQMLLRSSKEEWKSSRCSYGDDLIDKNRSEMMRSASSMIPEAEPKECMLSFSSSFRDGGSVDFSGCGGYSASSNPRLHRGLSGVSGPFTPSQWLELEHQALLYKYIISNVPIPSNLLTPIKKCVNPCVLSSATGSYPSCSLGWSPFHLGYLGNTTDPEPGRCRRTDGKKWRCSRDAVADQKYCERHMNRGRHRSRKPVEGRTGHSATGAAGKKLVSTSAAIAATPPAILQDRDLHLRELSGKNRPVLIRSEEIKPDATQLSMAIPPEFRSLSLSRRTGYNGSSGEFNSKLVEKQSSWIPISWDSVGGPLGEALATRNEVKYNNMLSRSFVGDEVDESPESTVSLTGVWQKTVVDSQSNSSSGCSSLIASSVNFGSPIPLL